MPVYPKQYNVQFNPFNAPQLGLSDGITYKPQYIVAGCKYTGRWNTSIPCDCELEDMALFLSLSYYSPLLYPTSLVLTSSHYYPDHSS